MKLQLKNLDPNGIPSLCLVSIVGTIGLSSLMILPILVGVYIGFQFLLPAIGLFEFPALLPDIGFNGMIKILVAMLILIGVDSPVGYSVGIGLYSVAWAFSWPTSSASRRILTIRAR